MARMNVKRKGVTTHEGAPACRVGSLEELRRSVASCLLWEDEFYESGEQIAERIRRLTGDVKSTDAEELALEARKRLNIRHAPLLIAAQLAANGKLRASTLASLISRADELCEFVSLFWKVGTWNGKSKKQTLTAEVKKGLAAAFHKFDAYQLAKYDRPTEIKLRDVMRLVHPIPATKEQSAMWAALIAGELKTPDTWETNLSAGKDKKETWTRLIEEKKLGGLAMLRNLRNMVQAGVDPALINTGMFNANMKRVLPMRFISAAKHVPSLEPIIEKTMLKCLAERPKLPGKTVVMVDVSGSMHQRLSQKSELNRREAAAALAILARELCEEARIFTFSETLIEVPARHGFALRDAIGASQPYSGTYLGSAILALSSPVPVSFAPLASWGYDSVTRTIPGYNAKYDRLIIITDEQSHDSVGAPHGTAYLVNVASNHNGVGYDQYLHIHGWSDSILDYIAEYEGICRKESEDSVSH